MKKIFFAGNHFKEGGPCTVNKNLITCLNKHVMVTTKRNKLLRFIEIFYKISLAKIVVFSGVTQFDHLFIPFCKILHRKIVYIMHGCLDLEYAMNNNQTNKRGLINEKILLINADKILCVSKPYAKFISNHYPYLQNKIGFLTNGIDWSMLQHYEENSGKVKKDQNLIILMGGGRVTKRNLQVCQAVEKLNLEEQTHFKVEVYGNFEDFDDSKAISSIPCVEFKGTVPSANLLERLTKSFLFIQNSEFESFSLGVIEALCCGCNILITPQVGAIDIIPGIKDTDLIHNNMDINEIQQKILGICQSSNNDRLVNSINKKHTSIQQSAKNLETILQEM